MSAASAAHGEHFPYSSRQGRGGHLPTCTVTSRGGRGVCLCVSSSLAAPFLLRFDPTKIISYWNHHQPDAFHSTFKNTPKHTEDMFCQGGRIKKISIDTTNPSSYEHGQQEAIKSISGVFRLFRRRQRCWTTCIYLTSSRHCGEKVRGLLFFCETS